MVVGDCILVQARHWPKSGKVESGQAVVEWTVSEYIVSTSNFLDNNIEIHLPSNCFLSRMTE